MAGRDRIARERAARTNLILDSAERLFVEKGYHDTSINDIAENADFSRTSVYQYFASKEEIYLQILDRYGDLLTERVTRATGDSSPLVELQCSPSLERSSRTLRARPRFS